MSKMQDARCKMHRKCSMSHVERAISQVLVLVTRHYAIIMIMSYELLLLTCCVLYKCHLQMRATECRMRGMRQVQACASRKLWLILVMVSCKLEADSGSAVDAECQCSLKSQLDRSSFVLEP